MNKITESVIDEMSMADLKALYDFTIFMRESSLGMPIYLSYYHLSVILLSEMQYRCSLLFANDPMFETKIAENYGHFKHGKK